MGKHKNRRKKNQQQKQQSDPSARRNRAGETSALANEYGTAPATTTTTSAVLQNIRHAHPNTRLAALTALQHHDPSRKKGTTKSTDLALWQAVREQVMDSNLIVASAAATCLETFVERQSSDDSDLATAGWYLVLLGRVQQAYQQVSAESAESMDTDKPAAATNDKNKTKKKPHSLQQQWRALALSCLSAMTCLVQENPVVTERLERSAELRRDSFDMLQKWLAWTTIQVKPENDNNDSDRMALQEQCASLYQTLMEDNANVVRPWYREDTTKAQAAMQQVWEWVFSAKSSAAAAAPSSSLSPLSRLHLVGVLLAALAQLPAVARQGSFSAAPLLDCLKSYLQPEAESDSQRLSMCEAHRLAMEQQEDFTLEHSVVQEVTTRKEPARAIARRLKQQKQKKKADQTQAPPHDATNDQDMSGASVVDDADHKMSISEADEAPSEKRGVLSPNRTDYVQEWERLLDDWRRQHVALELALEMTANLTAPSSLDPEDEMQVDDDDKNEEQMSMTSDVAKAFGDLGLLHELLKHFSVQLAQEWPPSVLQHLRELGSKVTACLGHALIMTQNDEDKDDAVATARDDQRLAPLWRDLVVALDRQPTAAGTMVVFLQSRPTLGAKVVQPQDVSQFVEHLATRNKEPATASEEAVVFFWNSKRDLIALLGIILCQQRDHTREMNHSVCRALVNVGSDSAAGEPQPVSLAHLEATAESLNVLMDLYGDDDAHTDVFEELLVLQHFQKTVPVLKQQMNQQMTKTQGREHADALENVKEICFNASRFVQYKKGH